MEIRGLIKIIIFILLCLVVHALQAQTLYSRDSRITVAPNTVITIKGSVENHGTLTNDGHLRVGGPWVNPGTYNAGVGQITFNSTSATIPQIIHHNGQTFNKLTLAGGTKKVILSDIVIGKEIHFQSGVVEASGGSKIVFNPDATISGASDSSHIHGMVYQKGSGFKLFPIGNGLIYLPVELLDVDDPSAIIGVQAFEFENINLAKPASLQSISHKRYWHIDRVSGAMNYSQVVLPLRDETWQVDAEKVVVVQSSSLAENFTSIGQAFLEGHSANGRVASVEKVSMPFLALGATAAESELVVHNAVSANGDGLNDFLTIENIESYPANKLSVYNRWGDKIFEIENYDNHQRVFRGRSNIHSHGELVSGTYFYVLDLIDGQVLRGFISVKN